MPLLAPLWHRTDQNAHAEELSFKLLDDLPAWRARSVEHVELTSAQLSKRERVIHVKPLREVPSLHRFVRRVAGPNAESATFILPIVDLPRITLLDFEITVDGQQVYRLTREETGEFQARYLRHIASLTTLPIEIDSRLEEFLVAIFTFHDSILEEELSKYTKLHKLSKWRTGRKDPQKPVREYLEGEFSNPISPRVFARWQRHADAIGNLALTHVPIRLSSAAQNPLLALPRFMREKNLTKRDASRLLARLLRLLTAASLRAQQGDENANNFLYSYASYGRRWEVLAKCKVPLNKPFIVKVHDKRPIFFEIPGFQYGTRRSFLRDRLLPTARQYVSFADAGSNHIHIRVPDDGVELVPSKCRAKNEKYDRQALAPSGEGKEREHYSRHDSKHERAKRIWIDCRLRPTRLKLGMVWGIISATLLAVALIVIYGLTSYDPQHKLKGPDIVAILIPVTFAGSLLIVKESTTLGMHVKKIWQITLMLAMFSLWVLTVILRLMGNIAIDDL
ncbi:hypothetical protein [Streptomyces bottropensis]|uniref:hypothetical protein n=1 Tax=Streptomyces bottropensis TaxID=42235 RepID=UPI0036B28C59